MRPPSQARARPSHGSVFLNGALSPRSPPGSALQGPRAGWCAGHPTPLLRESRTPWTQGRQECPGRISKPKTRTRAGGAAAGLSLPSPQRGQIGRTGSWRSRSALVTPARGPGGGASVRAGLRASREAIAGARGPGGRTQRGARLFGGEVEAGKLRGQRDVRWKRARRDRASRGGEHKPSAELPGEARPDVSRPFQKRFYYGSFQM